MRCEVTLLSLTARCEAINKQVWMHLFPALTSRLCAALLLLKSTLLPSASSVPPIFGATHSFSLYLPLTSFKLQIRIGSVGGAHLASRRTTHPEKKREKSRKTNTSGTSSLSLTTTTTFFFFSSFILVQLQPYFIIFRSDFATLSLSLCRELREPKKDKKQTNSNDHFCRRTGNTEKQAEANKGVYTFQKSRAKNKWSTTTTTTREKKNVRNNSDALRFSTQNPFPPLEKKTFGILNFTHKQP